MKFKIFFAVVFLFLTFLSPMVAEVGNGIDNVDDKKDSSVANNWAILQFGVFPGFPAVTQRSNVCGLKIGVPVSGGMGSVSGIEMSILGSTTATVYGMQLSSFANVTNVMDGVQVSGITNATNYVAGVQLSPINVSDIAAGLQMGVVNIDTKTIKGVQVGVVNFTEKVVGVQFGIVNIAKESGLQFGLLNYIEDGWIPYLPLMNISF
jgi:hypothetical protein